MAQLNHILGSVMRDIILAQHEANLYSYVLSEQYGKDGNDHMKETVQANYRRIKEEVKQIVQDELERIAGDDNLKHLLQQK